MNEEAVGEDEDEYDDNIRAEIHKMELAYLLKKMKANLGGQECEDEETASIMKEVEALLAEQEEDQHDEYDYDEEELYGYTNDEYDAIIAMDMAALMEEARVYQSVMDLHEDGCKEPEGTNIYAGGCKR